ncbi:hypothetical protein DUNSADRAFT_7515 [Dunaliella salina]|uniref:Uncharacterized protein n=1 Tax=Dunaliella salina TaxID=3046 RepID=A0ABQ7FT94_DUNSA|nr:hypothetical protein DUNSADRAFT_7515 [Dunaliella salina]|eukprot:KAF5825696.1 hypothetical protein DUNSADRAFT_7515 [Dunaliella salina]
MHMKYADRDNYEQMVDTLGKLEVDALFSVSVETHSKVQEMHGWTAEMKSMLEDFKKETPYVSKRMAMGKGVLAKLGRTID